MASFSAFTLFCYSIKLYAFSNLLCTRCSQFCGVIANVAQDIFIRWGPWHGRCQASQWSIMRVKTRTTLENYLTVAEDWNMIPASSIRLLQHKQRLVCYTLFTIRFFLLPNYPRSPKPKVIATISAY